MVWKIPRTRPWGRGGRGGVARGSKASRRPALLLGNAEYFWAQTLARHHPAGSGSYCICSPRRALLPFAHRLHGNPENAGQLGRAAGSRNCVFKGGVSSELFGHEPIN